MGKVAQFERVDVCIIGGGPAGLMLAEGARRKGYSVTLIEAGFTGGAGANWGAIPSQALAACAHRAHLIRNSGQLGIGADEPRINFTRINGHIRSIIAETAPDHSPEHLKAIGVEVIIAQARFSDRRTVLANDRAIRAKHFVIATGALPNIPAIPGLETIEYLTPHTIFELTRRPAHLLVLGGGATGMSLAQSHLRLGCEVTVIDMLEPLSDHDPELRAVGLRALEREGLGLFANTGIVGIGKNGDTIEVEIKSGPNEQVLTVSHVLLAAGHTPSLEGLNLAAGRIKRTPRGLLLNKNFRTSNPRVYCIGDATGDVASIGTARQHCEKVLAQFGNPFSILPQPFASEPLQIDVTYTDPELAQIGLNEPAARQRHKNRFAVTRLPFAQNSKALANRQLNGHIKLIVHASGRLLGASIAGPQAGEIASLAALAIDNGLSVVELARAPMVYTSYGQILSSAASRHLQEHQLAPIWHGLPLGKHLLP